MPEEEFYLLYNGRSDSVMFRKAIQHLNSFPLWRDSKAHVISYDEYTQLVKEEKIAHPESYWQIRPKQVGVVIKTYYRKYSSTWESVGTALQDFEAGWRACETMSQHEGR